ncbi:hypothetical protein TNCV_1027531 [Trichonephila clavipes]|nr:hypothetical protein TNCV_1027531 [Trichonephila clavipes]
MLVRVYEDQAKFLNCIFTEDESWCLRSLKRNDKARNGVRRKQDTAEKLRIKTILITFFDSQGIIHKEFLPERTMLNAAR